MIFCCDDINKKSSGIYCILNTISGLFYIGSTKNFWARYKCHFNSLKRDKHHSVHLQRSFNKHSKSIFQFIVLDVMECDVTSLLEREQKYLDFLQPYNNKIGYNVSRKANMIDAPVDKDRYRKLLGRPVIAYNLDGSFRGQYLSVTEAAEYLGIPPANIQANCARERIFRAGNFMCKYFDGNPYLDQIEPYKNPLIGRDRGDVDKKIVAVRKANGSYSGEYFRKYNKSRIGTKMSDEQKKKISASHKGKIKSPEHLRNNAISRYKAIMGFDWLGYPISHYDSLKDCAKQHGVTSATISEYIKERKPYRDQFLVFLPKNKIAA